MATTQVGTKLGIRKITARIGAEITGLSPDLILDPDTVAAVRAALNEHKALVFRGVRLDDGGQHAAGGPCAEKNSCQALVITGAAAG